MGIRNLYGVKIATAYSVGQSPAPSPQDRESQTLSSGEQEWSVKSLWERRPLWLRAFHNSQRGDTTVVETIVNVATSLPFIFIGLQTPRQKPLTKLYGNSLVGVGLASTLFHISRGEVRKYFRWADYTMIAASTLCLSRALQADNSKALYAASAVLLPFQPFVVAACHTGIMEAVFIRRSLKEPGLQKAHTLHTISTMIGGTLFVIEDMFPDTPFLHAGWHLAAAVGVSTCNKLLD